MHPLPEEVKNKLSTRTNGSEVLIAVESDLAPDGALGSQWLACTAERVYVLSRDHGSPEITHDLDLKGVLDIKADPMVGNGCLVANTREGYVPLIRYSNAVSREFSYAARVLEALAKGEDRPVATDEDRTRRCDKCDFPLETGSAVCANCVNRARAMRRLLGYLRPYRTLVLVSAALMLSSRALQLAPPYLTKILIDDVLGKAEPYRLHSPSVLPGGLRGELAHALAGIVGALIVTSLVSTILGIFQTRANARIGSRVTHDIRMELYSALQRLPLRFFDKRQTGAVVSRVSQDTSALHELLAFELQFFISNSLILVLVLSFLFFENWRLAAITLIPAPLASTAATIIFTRLRWMFRRMWHRWSRLHAVMSDSLQGLRVVKAFAQEDREVDRFEQRSSDLANASMQAEQTWGTMLPILWFVLTSGQFIVWYAGGLGVIDLKIRTGTLIMFIGYIGMLYGPLQMLTRIWDWIGRSLAASERIFEIIDSEKEEPNPEAQVKLPSMEGQVHFRCVTFGYDKNNPVLHDIDLMVEPGEMIGLVGHSGAGKSTMMNLLSRFYVPQKGVIEIDGVDLNRINLDDVRTQIGIVPQDPYLFSGTIYDNIAYAKEGASPEEVIRAAKAANAHDFIVNFPDGYETQVGERGQSLSGGERQRISIARAILHNPRILILDEATSSVDTATEKQIQEALARLIKDRTTFAIAHRLSTLRNANRLLVLEKGRQAELGTHEELIEKGGTYAKLVEMQTEMSRIVAVAG